MKQKSYKFVSTRETRDRAFARIFALWAQPALSAICLLLAATELRAQSYNCTAGNAAFCAGSTNPIQKPADATVFPVDGLLVMAPGASGSNQVTLPTYVNYGNSLVPQSNPWGIEPFQYNANFSAASGKIIAPGKVTATTSNYGYPQDVVYAWRHGANIEVDFANPSTNAAHGGVQLGPQQSGAPQLLAPQLDQATYGGTGSDHIAIAVGDLDGAVDANGETNDEVVVAFPALDQPTGVWVPQVYVLSYKDATGAPQVYENDSHANICGLPCFATQATFKASAGTVNQEKTLASGSILSLAIGDFDGDGANEIAMAFLQGYSNNVMISIFRFRTPQSQAPHLSFVSTTSYPGSISDAANPQSFVGSLSLISGDFNNDGKDELALGYPQWVKDSTATPGSSDTEANSCVVYAGIAVSQTGLAKGTCNYDGWSVAFGNYITLFQGGLTPANVSSIKSDSFAKGTTTLFLDNADQVISGKVFISGGSGSWMNMNGVWDVIYSDQTQLTIRLDSSSFGVAPGNGITVSTTAPFSKLGRSMFVNPRVDNPGSEYGAALRAIFDFRDNDSRPVFVLQPGLFHMDPSTAASFHQREIFAAWNTPTPAPTTESSPVPYWKYDLVASYFTVSSDGQNTITMGNYSSLYEPNPWARDGYGNPEYSYAHQRISLTASNFFGATDVNADPAKNVLPTWQWVIGTHTDHSGYHVRVGNVQSDNKSLAISQEFWLTNGVPSSDTAGTFPVVAYDPDGSSYFLGAPVLFKTESFTQPSFVLQEPPKHIAWLKGGDGNYSLVNISRNTGTKSSVSVDRSTGKNSSSTSTSGWDIANSVDVSAGAGVTIGNPKLIGGTASVNDDLKIGYERKASETKTNALSTTIETSSINSAPSDDFIQFVNPTINVWRYRIYGSGPALTGDGSSPVPDTNNPYKYYEIAIPGVPITQNVGGLNNDFYNPMHENGNILSYPPPYTGTNVPTDVSATPYTVNGQPVPTLTNGIMWNNEAYCYGSTSGAKTLSIAGASATTDQVDTLNTMTESNELKVGETANVLGDTSNFNADWSFGSNQSWGKSTVTGSTLQNNTALTFNLVPGNSQYAYNINPVMYYAINGALKMAYSVDIPSSGHEPQSCSGSGDNWTAYYSLPDPGLVLSHRIDYGGSNGDGDIYYLNGAHTREEMKSFFIQSPTADPVDSSGSNLVYQNLTTNPNPGDTVRLALAIYNYSLGKPANNITVNFSYVPMTSAGDPDGSQNNEYACGTPGAISGWICPDSYRKVMTNNDGSTVQVQNLTIPAWNEDPNNPNWKIVSINWTIPKTVSQGKYRVYVYLAYQGTETNPPQAACTQAPCKPLCTNINCVAPDLPDPLAAGQNNEGYAYVTIGRGTALGAAATHPDVRTTNRSLVAVGKRREWRQLVAGYQGQPLNMRVGAMSNIPEARYHRVFVTDQLLGETNAPPQGIAQKVLQGVATKGATAHFAWRPLTIGLHQLKAEVKELADDGEKGNNLVDLTAVILRAPGDVNGSGFVDAQDLRLIEQEKGKLVLASSCGYACDLNGDGRIDKNDIELAMVYCGAASCASSTGAPVTAQPIDFEAVQDFNETELDMVRKLKSADWQQLLQETEEQTLPQVQLSYLRALRRLSEITTPRGHRH